MELPLRSTSPPRSLAMAGFALEVPAEPTASVPNGAESPIWARLTAVRVGVEIDMLPPVAMAPTS